MYLTENFKEIVSGLAVITTILQFLSGVLVCKQYVDNKTTAEATPLTFICGILSCTFWLFYGLIKHDNVIVLVNMIGVTLMMAYTAVFFIYTFKKSSVMKLLFLTCAFILLVIYDLVTADDKELLVGRLGLMACVFTLLTVAAPMAKLLHVIRLKSTECLPFPMILMSFFVSVLWLLYGVIQKDTFLMLPNFIAGVLAVAQLSLFLIYPNKPTSSPNMVKNMIA